MPTPKVNWVEGEYFTPADANIVGQAIVDLQNEFATVESVLQFRGTWNATTNTPALVNGTGTAGHAYLVTTAGTALGKTFVVGDYVVYSGTIWDRATSTASEVTSTGVVTGSRLVSTVATGTAPLTVTSTTVVPNLNASLLNGTGQTILGTASTIATRDANANLVARGFIPGFATTPTATGTTTLTIASNPIQEFTGTQAQTVVLPTASVVAGQNYRVINNSSGVVTVQSSSLATITAVSAGTEVAYTCLVNTPTLPAHWEEHYCVGPTSVQAISGKTTIGATGAITGSNFVSTVATGTAPLTVASTTNVANLNASTLTAYGPSVTSQVNTVGVRDGSGRLFAHSFVPLFTTQPTAAATTTLAAGSSAIQEFTGTSTQTCVLATTTVAAGQQFTIINNSSGAVTVQSSALAAIGAALTVGTSATFTALVATPTTAAHWHRK